MKMKLLAFLFSMPLVTTYPLSAPAEQARLWEMEGFDDFAAGDVEEASVLSEGPATLPPEFTELYQGEEKILWSMAVDKDGTLYLGVGEEGKVLRLRGGGGGGEAEVFFDSEEVWASALALLPGGDLLVGTSPDGKVYRVKPSGEASDFFDPEEQYIWAIQPGLKGEVFIATGNGGNIYRVTAGGQAQAIFKDVELHVRALTLDVEGNLLAGGGERGGIYRFDSQGHPFGLFDAPQEEVTSIVADGSGNIYAAVVSGGKLPGGIPGPRLGQRREVVSGGEPISTPPPVTPPPPVRLPQVGKRGAVYRITPDGSVDNLTPPNSAVSVLSLALDDQARLFMGGGKEGHIYRFEGEVGRWTILTRSPSEVITALLPARGGAILVGGSQVARVHRLGPDQAKEGHYLSPPLDAGSAALWGRITWRHRGPAAALRLRLRSGNTEKPDDTWSPWARVVGVHDSPVDGQRLGKVPSPAARHLQWQADFYRSRGEGLLERVEVAYRRLNLPPRIIDLRLLPRGITLKPPPKKDTPDQPPLSLGAMAGKKRGKQNAKKKKKPARPKPGAAGARKGRRPGYLTAVWKVTDPNDDELTYELFYGMVGKRGWLPLKKDLEDPFFSWDATNMADGHYRLRVSATDKLSNPAGQELSARRESRSFVVDNSTPEISGLKAKPVGHGWWRVDFQVEDGLSPIKEVVYILDTEKPRRLFPEDGIGDSLKESYSILLEDLEEGDHALAVRATDRQDNKTTGQIIFTVKK